VAITASFGSVTVVVSDSYIMAAPAEAVIVSANSHLKTATSGAHDVTRVAGADYKQACVALLLGHVDGLPQGTAWLPGDHDQDYRLTAGKRKIVQAITLRYFNGERIPATPSGLGAERGSAARVDTI